MENRFYWQVRILPILFILLTAGILSFLYILELHQDKEKQVKKVTTEYLDQQKRLAKNRVMTALELTRFQSKRTKEIVRQRVKGRVDEAINIANAIYARYNATLSGHQIEEQIKLILSSAVFDHQDGYFFAVDMDTEKIIIHKLDNLIGYSMSQHEDLRGNLVLAQQKKLLSESDGAFHTIYFSKPTKPGKEFPKQLYVRYFKPFNWLIGTGEYLDDMEKRLQESVLARLKTIYTGDNNYFIVKKMHNLEGIGGEPYATLLLSNDLYHMAGQPLFISEQDSKGNYFRKDILEVLKNSGEGFVTYYQPSSADGADVKKTSFFLHDKTWSWTIGSGFYYDSLNAKLRAIENTISERITRQIWLSITITMTIVIVISTIFWFISRRIARTINTYSTQLQQAQKMESVGRLAGGVAHDYNNMLGVILGYAEIIKEDLSDDDPNHLYIEEIHKAAERSAEITNQLLAFSRQQAIAPTALDANAKIEQLVTMIKRLIGEDITLAWHPGSDLWPIYLDNSQFNQIIMNLCVNARDAIEETGIISIETKNITLDDRFFHDQADSAPGPYVMLSISDTGSGMDRQTQDKLFEPFFTTKERGKGKGTGLGLSTVYGILTQNRCFIKVYSEPGKGTTFNLYFPKHEGQTESGIANNPPMQNLRGTETIILVEDDLAILKMTTLILEELGYIVMPYSSPDEALKATNELGRNIDLLITDVVMPGMNGRELSEALKKRHPKLKTLFMSGYTADVIAHRGVLWKGINFIQKPFSKHDLSLKIREIFSVPSDSDTY